MANNADVDVFRHADRSLKKIYGYMAREFQNLGTSLGFDELNVLGTRKTVSDMYRRLDAYIMDEYARICRLAYREACRECKYRPDGFDYYGYVFSMLKAYDPLSDFVYTREWIRKRDRLFESIIATERGNQEMRKNLKRGLDVLSNQVRQYADNITTSARLKAFKDAKVKYIRWVTEKDERVCGVCAPRDEVIYPIDQFPKQPAHWRCRCYGLIASEEEYLAQQSA